MKPEMRITDSELAILKSMFAENVDGVKLLRKIFLPELSHNSPIHQNIDLWMSADIDDMPASDAIINLKARKLLISHLEQCLATLIVLAGTKGDSVEATKKKLDEQRQQNSSK